jgi:amino acid permease
LSESLKYSSGISTLLAVAFVAICSGLAVVALVQGKTQTPKLVPRLDYQTSFFDLFTAVPVVVTAFTFHFNGTELACIICSFFKGVARKHCFVIVVDLLC